jgi:hypothetical protein
MVRVSQPDRDTALRALDAPLDLTGAVVDHTPDRVDFVRQVSLPADLAERLLAEADRRGVTPDEAIRDLVAVGLAFADDSRTIRLADAYRALADLATRPV